VNNAKKNPPKGYWRVLQRPKGVFFFTQSRHSKPLSRSALHCSAPRCTQPTISAATMSITSARMAYLPEADTGRAPSAPCRTCTSERRWRGSTFVHSTALAVGRGPKLASLIFHRIAKPYLTFNRILQTRLTSRLLGRGSNQFLSPVDRCVKAPRILGRKRLVARADQ
jgi:hypothetical protein